ncbi:N-acyl-phosphatidylethanolamine-hydrolyzing phospholipase D [Lecanosticta acicola]|uniref:N-acyl-phosphatidylethanolamine-hydrolyzing phospholipase D n=1 Tax=Lecanosticta acicola TaxID=111012 RepID=A0AAI8YVE3_9PEZI|nr:N-acyl-phosphatidylethanolamine-hydrolyzing phospholipase D [Lecanosticta acicola]
MSSMATVHVSPPSETLPRPSDADSKLHHRQKGVGFVNPWPSYAEPKLSEFLKWIFLGKITGSRTDPDTTPPHLSVHAPSFLPTRATKALRATWLGHACYYLELPSGLRVLFDPVFTQRCSPFTFLGPKRYTDMPCQIEDLPFIDAVVISHNHYDHMSHPTLVKIREKHKNVHFFVPLGNLAWFEREGFQNVTELDWWEERDLRISLGAEEAEKTGIKDMEARISCLPCQHTSARGAFDRSHTLWASWSVQSGGKSVWFGGDTGYRSVPHLPAEEFDYGDKHADLARCPAFKQIGELRGPFDLGLIPIGAYDPRWLMSPMHANPFDSVNIFQDTRCERALGIHWGTWVLTQEEVLEPRKLLKEALKWKGLDEEGVFDVCNIGDSREF